MPRLPRRYVLAAAAALAINHSLTFAAAERAGNSSPSKKPAATAAPATKSPTAKSTPDTPSSATRPTSTKPAAGKPAAGKPAAAKPAATKRPPAKPVPDAVPPKPTAAQLSADPFDGKSLVGWITVDGKPAGDGWQVVDGVIHRKPGGRAGNIVTAREFGDFDLSFEWKIAPKGNSGLKYRVKPYGNSWLGLEYQIYDDNTVKKVPPRGSTGALYDLYEPNAEKALKPVGQYNTARIVVKDGKIEHWLNGKRIVAATVGDKEWQKRIAESKFNDRKAFAQNEVGRIMLTDHGSEVWYRNFRLAETK